MEHKLFSINDADHNTTLAVEKGLTLFQKIIDDIKENFSAKKQLFLGYENFGDKYVSTDATFLMYMPPEGYEGHDNILGLFFDMLYPSCVQDIKKLLDNDLPSHCFAAVFDAYIQHSSLINFQTFSKNMEKQYCARFDPSIVNEITSLRDDFSLVGVNYHQRTKINDELVRANVEKIKPLMRMANFTPVTQEEFQQDVQASIKLSIDDFLSKVLSTVVLANGYSPKNNNECRPDDLNATTVLVRKREEEEKLRSKSFLIEPNVTEIDHTQRLKR